METFYRLSGDCISVQAKPLQVLQPRQRGYSGVRYACIEQKEVCQTRHSGNVDQPSVSDASPASMEKLEFAKTGNLFEPRITDVPVERQPFEIRQAFEMGEASARHRGVVNVQQCEGGKLLEVLQAGVRHLSAAQTQFPEVGHVLQMTKTDSGDRNGEEGEFLEISQPRKVDDPRVSQVGGPGEIQRSKVFQPAHSGQPSVRDWRVAQDQLTEFRQPGQIFQILVGRVGKPQDAEVLERREMGERRVAGFRRFRARFPQGHFAPNHVVGQGFSFLYR